MGNVNTTKLIGAYWIRPDPPLDRTINRCYIWDSAWLLDRNDYWVRVGHKNAGKILLGSMNLSPWALNFKCYSASSAVPLKSMIL